MECVVCFADGEVYAAARGVCRAARYERRAAQEPHEECAPGAAG